MVAGVPYASGARVQLGTKLGTTESHELAISKRRQAPPSGWNRMRDRNRNRSRAKGELPRDHLQARDCEGAKLWVVDWKAAEEGDAEVVLLRMFHSKGVARRSI